MKIVTSLSFRGQCKEAFEFYARVLGGRITAAFPYGEGPPDMPVGPQYKDWLMHAWLEVGDQSIMGADMDTDWAPHIEKPKNGFDVTLHYDDAAEAKRIFDALSEGGQVIMDFSPTFWSPGYGNFIDRFGVPWMVNTSGQPSAG
ncbi:MAG TPA: VOC family protein [Brevundimonas sp.]|uniref:VOC family protein n=1 Tax=Brevundimonas sp. TaxID=1871086 RepID=UPI00262E8BD4|nr:VOC family protein [Brevundimonas sp.]HRO33449.1 VOC family protein [Brevundimonas sp.]